MPPAENTASPLPAPSGASAPTPAWKIYLVGLGLVVAGFAAYGNSFSAPFIFDDQPTIIENMSIRHLWPVWNVLWPVGETPSGASGRPMENLSLAVNYSLGRLDVHGYHALNLLIHLLAGLTLFGVVRRTLLHTPLRAKFGDAALPLAGMVALLWIVHPLLTETVDGIAQRNESLMALFYLLTLSCFIRGVDSPQATWWRFGSVVACLLGMASKEVMVSAPLIIFLYDRTFLAGTFREAWAQRWKWYLGLATTWLLLAVLVLHANQRGETVGFGLGVSPWAYALTQCEAIMLYLRLAFWPYPLVLDYGTDVVTNPLSVAPQAAVLLLLLAGTIYALQKKPALGFAGASFFLVLAPSSSIVPLVTQTMAEHRMYLPLAVVISLLVPGLYSALGRGALVGLFLCSLALGALTFERNQDYHTELRLWENNVAARPSNPLAREAYGQALSNAQRYVESVNELAAALRLHPHYPGGEFHLGTALAAMGRPDLAVNFFIDATEQPQNQSERALAYYNLSVSLEALNRLPEALAAVQSAIQLRPDYAPAYNDLGIVLSHSGQFDQAVAAYQQALKLHSDFAAYEKNLGAAYMRANQPAQALPYYQKAALHAPDDAEAFWCVGNAYSMLGQYADAIAPYRTALRLKPAYLEAHLNLGYALVHLDRAGEAVPEFEAVLRLDPASASAQAGLTAILQKQPPPATAPVKSPSS